MRASVEPLYQRDLHDRWFALEVGLFILSTADVVVY